MAVESDFRSRIAKYLREHGYMVQAVETGAVAEGVPDLWFSKKQKLPTGGSTTHSGWLELKKIREMPKRPTTKVFQSMNHPLLQMQENWIEQALEHGTSVNILVGYGKDYFLVPGSMAAQFNDFTETDLRKYQVDRVDLIGTLLCM